MVRRVGNCIQTAQRTSQAILCIRHTRLCRCDEVLPGVQLASGRVVARSFFQHRVPVCHACQQYSKRVSFAPSRFQYHSTVGARPRPHHKKYRPQLAELPSMFTPIPLYSPVRPSFRTMSFKALRIPNRLVPVATWNLTFRRSSGCMQKVDAIPAPIPQMAWSCSERGVLTVSAGRKVDVAGAATTTYNGRRAAPGRV